MARASRVNWMAITAADREGASRSDYISHIMDVVFYGHPERGRMAVIAGTVDSFLDESSDEERKDVYSVGGFLSVKSNWEGLQKDWQKRLDEDNIAYFHTASCKKVDGPFLPLRRKYGFKEAQKIAATIRADLESILTSSDRWGGFGLCIVVPDYDYVLQEVSEARWFFAEDCTVAAYQQMMYQITRAVRREDRKALREDGIHLSHSIAFFVDESSMSKKVCHAFQAIKTNHPVLAESMATCAPMDDKVTPPLQIADLLAGITKDAFLKWLSIGKPRNRFQLEQKWVPHFVEPVGIWDTKHMLRMIIQNLSSSRFAKGTLAVQQLKITKRDRKRLRKELIKRLADCK